MNGNIGTMQVKSDLSIATTTTKVEDLVSFDISNLPNGITYKGLKAVLSFANPINWNINSTYDALTVVFDTVTHASYASKRPVPQGIELTNDIYWLKIADGDAQVEEYRQLVEEYKQSVDIALDETSRVYETVNDVPDDITYSPFYVRGYRVAGVGAAWYQIVENDAEFAIKKGNVYIAPIIGDVIDPAVIGAYCDGVTDDSDYIQNAIDSGKSVVITNTHRVGKTITIPEYTTIIGSHGSEYHYDIVCDEGIPQIFKMTGPGSFIYDLSVKGTSNSSTCFYFDRVGESEPSEELTNTDIQFKNVRMFNFNKCISTTGRNTIINGCHFSNSNTGVEIRYFGGKFHQRGVIITNTRFHSINNDGNGVCVACNPNFSQYDFGNVFAENFCDFCDVGFTGNFGGWFIQGNTFLLFKSYLVNAINSGAAISYYRNARYGMVSNTYSADANATAAGVNISGISNYNITGNKFSCVDDFPLLVADSCNGLVVSDNIFDSPATGGIMQVNGCETLYVTNNYLNLHSNNIPAVFTDITTFYSGGNVNVATSEAISSNVTPVKQGDNNRYW